ncbi:LOW QUALITY PROTEIN: photosynthetic NDH subunit of lumenal location 4, chloroplastic-like [Durio zibethinus]|uniref:peptidylprolyl isomerase n=1 Tax=Durio zibethinus TaxID=66656 RepID=A0A6P5YLB1_DURZI|nr:LOW QUALITY PROTEIN: photosynthetic NDH subunit of lumenal location 4, chloroplastic-like [Durio zibethinus]
MATSALTIATAKPLTHHFSNFKSPSSPLFSCSCYSSLPPPPSEVKLSMNSKPTANKCVFNVGVGLLATSVLALSPLDADATRIEYFATVGEPQFELNYASSGLGYCDVIVGFGEEAPRGELVNIHYTARFADGIVFDSSYKRARPLTMRIGLGKVIKGLDQGILGGEGVPPMLVGGKRKLQIPPNLAYGPEPAGCFSGDCNKPASATLLYDINFVGVYSGNAK